MISLLPRRIINIALFDIVTANRLVSYPGDDEGTNLDDSTEMETENLEGIKEESSEVKEEDSLSNIKVSKQEGKVLFQNSVQFEVDGNIGASSPSVCMRISAFRWACALC